MDKNRGWWGISRTSAGGHVTKGIYLVCKMSIFVYSRGWGVIIEYNLVHLVVECPQISKGNYYTVELSDKLSHRFSIGNNRFLRFVVFEEKLTGFTFVTAFRYFPIFFLTRITGNREITVFRTSPKSLLSLLKMAG